MSSRRLVRCAIAALAAVVAAFIGGPARAGTSAQFNAGPKPSERIVTLITGERVLEISQPNGPVQFAALSGTQAAPLFTYRSAAVSYIVDAVARPFIGGKLDGALFDTANLTVTRGAQGIPVRVQWHGTSAPAMPWLIDQRAVGADVTGGIITASSGAQLREALSQQPASPTAVWAGPLSGVDRISFDGATQATLHTPYFVQHTLTINGINALGRPANGDALLILNTDDARKFVNFAIWGRGIIKLSVPNGHYALQGQFVTLGKTGGGAMRIVTINTKVRGDTTVTIDARAATSQVSVSTPLAYASGSATIGWQRSDAAGFGFFVSTVLWEFGDGLPPFRVYVASAPAPRVGSQAWFASFHLDSSATPAPYSYDLAFGSVGSTPVSQHYVATASQLASIRTGYFSDVPHRFSLELRSGTFPWQLAGGGFLNQFTAPLRRTEYVSASPALVWNQVVIEDPQTFAGLFLDSNRVFQAGQQATAKWGDGPVGPGLQVNTGAAANFQACPVCLDNGTLEFGLFPFGDNPPGHFGLPNFPTPGISETDRAVLQRDGVTIASGPDPQGAVPVPPGRAQYRLTYRVAMSAPFWTLSTKTVTTWQFSVPQSLSAPLPPSWTCFSGTSLGCSVVALMFPDYQLPLNLRNELPPGPVSFTLGIVHVLDVPVALKQADVEVSFDHGGTWQPAHVVHNGTGGYTVSYGNPAGASTASLRISVADADGSLLDQTIIDAYAISS
jgi:hypothetical protein